LEAEYDIRIAWGADVTNPFVIGTSLIGDGDEFVGSFNVDFEGTYDDVTLDTEGFDVKRGRDDPLTEMQAGTCALTLFDLDGRYNPGNVSSPLYGQIIPMRQLRITATHDGTDYILFRGFLRTADYDPVTYRTEFVFDDLFTWLSRSKPVISLTSTTTGAAIQEILTESGWTVTELTDLDEGDAVDTFSMAGTVDSRNSLQGIADLLEAERGIFFVARDGTATYIDRHTLALQASVASLTDYSFAPGVAPGVSLDNLINRARVLRTGGVEQEATNGVSISSYGVSDYSLESAYFVDDAQALGLASFLVDVYGSGITPVWAVPMMANADSALFATCLAADVGQRVTLTSTAAGLDGDYHIESVRHVVRRGSYHGTEWSLSRRPFYSDEVFVIGTSTISGGDVFAYF
jgi:hypothetical protein